MTTQMFFAAAAGMAVVTCASADELIFSWPGDTSFNTFEITVPAFEAAQFVGINSQAGVFRSWAAGVTTFTFDIRLEGVWTTMWSQVLSGPPSGPFSLEAFIDAAGPVGFDSGTIDGFRFTSDNNTNPSLRQFNALNSGIGTVLFFDSDPIPAPGAAGVVGLAGVLAARRRR